MNYDQFIEAKTSIGGNHGFEPTFLPWQAFYFQESLCDWAIRKGRAAIFADCGLGKTLMELTFAENVVRHTNKPVLLLTPLAVGPQTIHEAEKFGVDAVLSRDGKFTGSRVVVTNYQRLHYFNPEDFAGTVCDESSILKNFDGTTKEAINSFMLKQRYRLLCTATAAPNDFIELGTSSEALGYLPYLDMLKKFFKSDNNTYAHGGNNGGGMRRFAAPGEFGGKFRFRGHAERDFWRWVCSWARACRKPSDLGFDDGKMTLPPLITKEHIIKAVAPAADMLFDLPAVGLAEQRAERSRTMKERCETAAQCVDGFSGPVVMWTHLNGEADLLERITPGAIQVSGADSDEEKEEKFAAFEAGQIQRLVTKPTIAGFGLNWQHCHRQTFFPSHSFEQWYQAIRRSWRFGQKEAVTVDVIASEGERGVLQNLQRKAIAADQMFANLVALMSNELKLEKTRTENTQTKLPSWL